MSIRILDIVKELFEEDSPAAQQAKKMGLTYLGFGRWGKDGTMTHRTIDGKLQPVSTKQAPTSQARQSFTPSDVNQDIGPKSKVAELPDEFSRTFAQKDGSFIVPKKDAARVLPGLMKGLLDKHVQSSIDLVPQEDGSIQVIPRKIPGQEKEVRVNIGPISVNPKEGTAQIGDEPLKLTVTELKLLTYLGMNQNKLATREDLLTKAWNAAPDMQTRTVDMYVVRLKKKLRGTGLMIKSVRGKGYQLIVPEEQ